MNLSSALSAETYLNNKEYFDSSLIRLLNKQQSQIRNLQKSIGISKAAIYKKTAVITTLKWKYKDLNVVHYNLKQRLKDTEEDTHKIITDMDKEIRNINIRIDDELQKSYMENNELFEELQRMKKENEKLRRERDSYKKMAIQDSTNSSLPPSMDIFKASVSLRKTSTRKRGAQAGHKLHTSKLKQIPTTVIEKTVRKAPHGAVPIFNDAKEIIYYVTQEIDVDFKTVVMETRYYIEEDAEELPMDILRTYKINSVAYANAFKSKVLYLSSKGTIALNRLCIMLNELSDGELHLSTGTIVNWSKEFYQKSEQTREKIVKEVQDARVVNVDETGWKVNGKNHWMQILCTDTAAYFVCTKKRADEEIGPIKILERYQGNLVHDHFKSYYRLKHCTHNQCNVHILRYLRAGVDFYDSIECAELIGLLTKMNVHKKELLEKGITKMEYSDIEEYEKRYLEIIEKTVSQYNEENPHMARKYVPTYIKTMERMKVYKSDHLRFIEDFSVPFDNNDAERQARSVKAKKKIAGQSISIETANHFAAIQTINQTCILRKENTLQTIEDILNNKDVFIT